MAYRLTGVKMENRDRVRTLARRRLLAIGLVAGTALTSAALVGCGETRVVTETKIQEVIKEVPVERVVTQIVEKERLVEVEKVVTREVEKIVVQEKIVEKLVTAAPAKPTQTSFDWFYIANAPGAFEHVEEIVIPRFNGASPHITVKPEGKPWGEYLTKINTLMAADAVPDLIVMDDVLLPAYSARGAIRPLDEFYKRDGHLLENMADLAGGIDHRVGKVYGVNRMIAPTAVLYNAELVEAAGVEPPDNDSPWTWDEWVENFQKMTWDKQKRHPGQSGFDVENVEQWGLYLKQAVHSEWIPAIRQNGGEMLSDDTTTSGLGMPETIEAMQWVHDHVWKFQIAPTRDQVTGFGSEYDITFVSGAAMAKGHISGQEAPYPKPDKAKYEIKAMVHPIGAQHGATMTGHQMMISKVSQKAEEAWAFALFHATDVPSSIGIYTVANYGVPPDKTTWDLPEVKSRDHYPRDYSAFFHPALNDYGYPMHPSPFFGEWHSAFAKANDEAAYNRLSVNEAMERAHEDTQEVIDRFFKLNPLY